MEKFERAPVIEIEGTRFLVDVSRQELREIEDPRNRIAFADMSDKGDHYAFGYDPVTKNRPGFRVPKERVARIKIPQMVTLDPEGVAARYHLQASDLIGKCDLDLVVDPELVKERLAGKLPTIWIAGDNYMIDIRMSKLTLVADSDTFLLLSKMHLTDNGKAHEAYYHPARHELVEIDPAAKEFPEGVVRITIPNILHLDPIGVSEWYGIEQREFLRRFPPQKELQATVTPFSETNAATIIKTNRERVLHQNRKGHERINKGHKQ